MDVIKAVVQKIVLDGRHGPFVVATSDRLSGSVTFSLERTVWQESEYPDEGMFVFLDNIRQKRAGWRAKLARFWKPSDEQAQQIERSNGMEFLYPTSRQFPFDEVSDKIVRELEKRNWQVPGITVEFGEYGSGAQRFRRVSYIRGEEFKLWFCRVQRTMPGGRWNDTAALTEIVIPQKELNVYEDESGPTFYLYTGTNWKRDREKFMNGSKVHGKLRGEKKFYLQYSGGCDCAQTGGASFDAVGLLTATITGDAKKLSHLKHSHPGRRSPLLVHDNDLGREYDPERGKWDWLNWKREPDEPKVFRTGDVMSEFTTWLENNVLAVITAQPIPTEKNNVSVEPVVPMPEAFGPLFCFAEYRDAERIQQGKIDPNALDASNRYGLEGGGYRLASLDLPNDGTIPKIAYEGFLWCGIGEVTAETDIEKLEVPGHYRWSDRERFVVRVTPTSAKDIYIADHAAHEKRRKEIWDAITDGRDRLTNAEVADFLRARARTIIPITEYKGGFEQPLVLINRELSFDEVEVVSGPHEERRFRRDHEQPV